MCACAAFAWPAESTLVPRNAGHPEGDPLWARLFLVCAAGALVAYALACLVFLKHKPPSLRAVAALAVAIQLAPLAAPLLLSTDAWTYWSYSRLDNPYRTAPAAYPDDPSFPWVGTAWRDTTSVYGPAFTLAAEPVAATEDPDVAAWTFKLLAAAAMVAATLLATRLAQRKAAACALVGWNPLLALHFAGGGHNDVWFGALVVGALAAGAAGRRQLPGVLWALAIFIKWVPLVLLPLRALEAHSRGRRVGHLGFAGAALVLAGVAFWRYGNHWLDIGPLARNANEETEYALPHRLEQLGVPDVVAAALAATAFAAAYLWLVRSALRGRARLALATGFVLLATPYLTPWYLAWLAPLAAAEEDDAARWLTIALSAYLLPQTIPV